MSLTVLYTAAHGDYAEEVAPLGGGATISDLLVAEWRRTRPFELRLLSPRSVMGDAAPSARELLSMGERGYARFCRAFERATTAEILTHDPAATMVLSNDVSEGPDFQALHAAGYRIFTICHVDVVAYISAIYARGLVSPATLTLLHDLARFAPLPDIARLIFEKQLAAVECSVGLVVPSSSMKDVLLASYPGAEPVRVHVMPWGVPEDLREPSEEEISAVRREYQIPENALVLLTLSRLSPEKGQDLLLDALIYLERTAALPERPLWLFVCGGAAYMHGRRYEAKLRRLASQLEKVRVVFPGHVTGARKRALLALADLYVFPSRHESYGLTLLEAMRAGLPAVCMDSAGAREIMRPEFGQTVRAPARLDEALLEMLGDDELRQRCGAAAREFAIRQRFEDTAARLAGLVGECASAPT